MLDRSAVKSTVHERGQRIAGRWSLVGLDGHSKDEPADWRRGETEPPCCRRSGPRWRSAGEYGLVPGY